jgi:Domain of unknown function (DUF4352)
MLKSLVAALAIATLTGCSAGAAVTVSATTPTVTAVAAQGTIGQPVPVSWDKGRGQVTINAATQFRPEYGTRKNPAGYLALDVTYALESGTAPYNPLYWTVRDSDGHEYDFTVGPDPRLKSGDLAAGETVRGWIAFDVPAGATLTVFLDDFDGHLAAWPLTAD